MKHNEKKSSKLALPKYAFVVVVETIRAKQILSSHKHKSDSMFITRHFMSSGDLVYVPAGSPSHGGDVTIYVKDINQTSVPTPVYSVLVSISVFLAHSTVFPSVNSPNNSPFSHSALQVLSLLY